MTWGGGKPHAVGDRGQRYEVTYLDMTDRKRKVFGWTNERPTAQAMCRSISLSPTMKDGRIQDRAKAVKQDGMVGGGGFGSKA